MLSASIRKSSHSIRSLPSPSISAARHTSPVASSSRLDRRRTLVTTPPTAVPALSLAVRGSNNRNGKGCRKTFLEQQWSTPVTLLSMQSAGFHSTPSRHALPMVPLLAVFKTAASMEVLRTLGRIALTLSPFLVLKNVKTKRHIKWHTRNQPWPPEKIAKVTKGMRRRTLLFHILIFIPGAMFWATIIACLERTPLTGRWRIIILSPEEEEEIASQLAGPGWYQAVNDILAQDPDGPPRLIRDWRYSWVLDTLRKLEAIVPILQQESELGDAWALTSGGPDGSGISLPPPAEYPLQPRPRAAESLKRMCDMMCDMKKRLAWQKQKIAGPPYSLLVVDKPEAANAFSYGFGADGGGGIVVYSGFLDDIMKSTGIEDVPTASAVTQRSWWSYLFGGLVPSGSPPPSHPVPTPEQTTKLAILLAHELSHLLLAHHLESLSSSSVVVPGIVSIFTDITRVLIFPITMLFGPFVNDAVAQLGKVGSIELNKIGEYCNSVQQEIEADVVSARLLAHAGFDARSAIRFWEDRQETARTRECSTSIAEKTDPMLPALRILGNAHPVNETRVQKLKGELVRWETERRALIYRRLKGEQAMEKEKSSVVLMMA